MNRRNLIKLIGGFLVAPTLVLNKGIKVAKTVTSQLFGTKVIEPITINGTKYYVMMMHPRQEYCLRVSVARDKYKHQQWVKRYNKWRASRGETLYRETGGETGTFEGLNFNEIA